MKRLWDVNENKKKERVVVKGRGLINIVFSWSLLDVLNSKLYEGKVDKIPNTFPSTTEYFNSFVNPLIEETHTALLSCMETLKQAPSFRFFKIKLAKDFKPPKDLFYEVTLQIVSDTTVKGSQKKLEMNDLIAVAAKRVTQVNDLRCSNEAHLLALVCKVSEYNPNLITILASKPIVFEDDDSQTSRKGKNVMKDLNLFGVYLINMTTDIRIWNGLHQDPKEGNLKLISKLLQINSEVDDGSCVPCKETNESVVSQQLKQMVCSFKLNSSQEEAILCCLEAKNCYHSNTIKLIWGPPGTGKTKTTSVLLLNLLKVRCRTLTCAPTNIAVMEVASRVVKLLFESVNFDGYGLGDIVLFGNNERMKIDDQEDLFDVFLDYRLGELCKCFTSLTGWRAIVNQMISLLNDPKQLFDKYLINEERRINAEEKDKEMSQLRLSFQKFVQGRFTKLRNDLHFHFSTLCLHLPTTLIPFRVAEKMNQTNGLFKDMEISEDCGFKNDKTKQDCLKMLQSICESIKLPDVIGMYELKSLCLENAYLLFCTASSSANLKKSSPIQLLVIDEAAQLKECESTIPLQLPGLRHVVLIGDEKQLPPMVQSKIASKADFGRSLFERLVMLGQKKQLLNIQYRMHPAISMFPNREFYGKKILDAPSVKLKYERKFLPEKMYGPYSFINIDYGREHIGEGHSLENVVEAFVVAEIISKLYAVSRQKQKPISVGVIAPYKAQVSAIQNKIGEKYNTGELFTVNVRSVDGFQGGEEDIIIISTVRSNDKGIIGFLSNQQRANVALTRARYCLWILGNEATLKKDKSVWRKVINDAKSRKCFHDVEDDASLAQCIERSTTTLSDLNKLQSKKMLSFENSIWKVSLSNEFLQSLEAIVDSEINRKIKNFLEKLSNGEKLQQDLMSENENMFRQHEIHDGLILIWTIDITKKRNHHVQVLRIWHVLPSSNVSYAEKHIKKYYKHYTKVKIEQCRYICSKGNLVVPMKWPANSCSKNEITSDISRSFEMLSVGEETVAPKTIKKQWKLKKVSKIRRNGSASTFKSKDPK